MKNVFLSLAIAALLLNLGACAGNSIIRPEQPPATGLGRIKPLPTPAQPPPTGFGRIKLPIGFERPIGVLSKDQISRVVRSDNRGFRYCYEKGLISDPTLRGKLVVKMVILASGKVGTATVQKREGNLGGVGKCVANKSKNLVFPKPKGGGTVTVKWPFVFSPKD